MRRDAVAALWGLFMCVCGVVFFSPESERLIASFLLSLAFVSLSARQKFRDNGHFSYPSEGESRRQRQADRPRLCVLP